jgi:SWIM/SEC-C metal-binding protein
MARLGSRKRPAIVRVQTEAHAREIVDLCDAHGWQVIVGVEPDASEDVSDVRTLLAPTPGIAPQPPTVGRNAPCPCGSGRKYKKCCLTAAAGAPSTHPENGET